MLSPSLLPRLSPYSPQGHGPSRRRVPPAPTCPRLPSPTPRPGGARGTPLAVRVAHGSDLSLHRLRAEDAAALHGGAEGAAGGAHSTGLPAARSHRCGSPARSRLCRSQWHRRRGVASRERPAALPAPDRGGCCGWERRHSPCGPPSPALLTVLHSIDAAATAIPAQELATPS